jgi:SWI/SNF related-matrix-associated actin-dependent regulator of chromatin subfamily C
MVRRTIPSDAGSIIRLHEFLTCQGLLNEDAINDSAPTPVALLGGDACSSSSRLWWNNARRETLMHAVVESSKKRQKQHLLQEQDDTSFFVPIDWEFVAKEVGHGATSADCEQQFLSMPIQPEAAREGSITPDTTASSEHKERTTGAGYKAQPEMIRDLIEHSDPQVIHAVVQAALEQTPNLGMAQQAAIAGLGIHQAVQDARSEEDAIACIMSEIVELRMQKLENRMALLDDVEGLLEAERVALELERRDLYTARCRHWFGGP